MSPLRIAQLVPYETAYTLERAYNDVLEVAERDEAFSDEDAAAYIGYWFIAQRQIVSSWTGERTPAYDADNLRSLVKEFRGTVDIDGSVVIRTTNFEELNDRERTDYTSQQHLTDVMRDGLCEWLLRGRTRDVRACVWCGRLFRADRTGALFDRTSCRTAYHRARNAAAGSANPDRSALMGFFQCPECDRELLIDSGSGLVLRDSDSSAFIGPVRAHTNSICRDCAQANHAEWAEYLPILAAA